jgi:hypothetical protein
MFKDHRDLIRDVEADIQAGDFSFAEIAVIYGISRHEVEAIAADLREHWASEDSVFDRWEREDYQHAEYDPYDY